jgi:hypothetical protein
MLRKVQNPASIQAAVATRDGALAVSRRGAGLEIATSIVKAGKLMDVILRAGRESNREL